LAGRRDAAAVSVVGTTKATRRLGVALGGSLSGVSSSVKESRYCVAAQRESEHDGQLANGGVGDHAATKEGAVEGVVAAFTVFTPATAAVGVGQAWCGTSLSDRDDADQFLEPSEVLSVSTVEI